MQNNMTNNMTWYVPLYSFAQLLGTYLHNMHNMQINMHNMHNMNPLLYICRICTPTLLMSARVFGVGGVARWSADGHCHTDRWAWWWGVRGGLGSGLQANTTDAAWPAVECWSQQLSRRSTSCVRSSISSPSESDSRSDSRSEVRTAA